MCGRSRASSTRREKRCSGHFATSTSRVDAVRIGRIVDIELEAADAEQARAEVQRMCEQLLANPLIESFDIDSLSDRRHRLPRLERRSRRRSCAGIARRRDGARLARGRVAARRRRRGAAGGFSYGDYLRCGAIARFAPVMRAVTAFAADGGLVLGICNGFQILCEAGLLPGALRPNTSLSFVCRDVGLRVERADTPFTARAEHGQRLVIPVKHGEGCYVPPPELAAEQIVLRYEPDANPNGSVDDIAGVVSEGGNVMGLMPHPEHAVDPLLGSEDGALILGSLVDAVRAAPKLHA